MEYKEKDLKNKLKPELVEIAKTMPAYNPKIHKTKEVLIAIIMKKDLPTKAKSKKDLLIEKASKFIDFNKSVHGKSIATLEAFIASKSETTTATPVPVVKEKTIVAPPTISNKSDLLKLNFTHLKNLAKKHGYKITRTVKKPELIEFLVPFYSDKTPPATAAAASIPAVVEIVEKEEEMVDWPIPADVLAKNARTVDALKKLLKSKGIETGLPRTKDEILALFKKSRCSFKDFTCSENDFCDLRNNLCRDLGILRNKDNEIKKLAKGLVYIDEASGRFYGTPEAIAKVRTAFLNPIEAEVVVQTEAQKTPVAATAHRTASSQQQEEGISPININRLLDKPSENDIRKAILHCLGLYQDIDPNDEIIMN